MARDTHANVALIGTGMIGRSWAICFARAGETVRLYDHVDGAVQAALPSIRAMLDDLAVHDLLLQQDVEVILDRIAVARHFDEALDGVAFVQESTPEEVGIKRDIFRELSLRAPRDAIIASSTSALLPSQFTEGLDGAERCLVAHPLNPPHLIPAVGIVPGPHTLPECVVKTVSLMRAIGQQPVVANTEVPGFIMNRLQGAVLDEAFALVRDGVASVEDIDIAMREGLARRWCFMGPFETIDLNAPGGVATFLERYRAAYAEIGKDRPNRSDWKGALVDRITASCRSARPADTLDERQNWRNAQLAALAAFKMANRRG